MEKIDEDVSFNFWRHSSNSENSYATTDDNSTLNYTMSQSQSKYEPQDDATIHDDSFSSEASQSLLIIPTSRMVVPKTRQDFTSLNSSPLISLPHNCNVYPENSQSLLTGVSTPVTSKTKSDQGLSFHETNKELPLNQTSTPVNKRLCDGNLTRNDITYEQGLQNQMLLKEIKSQIYLLQQLSLNLQGQVEQCNLKIDSLIEKSATMPQIGCAHNISDTTEGENSELGKTTYSQILTGNETCLQNNQQQNTNQRKNNGSKTVKLTQKIQTAEKPSLKMATNHNQARKIEVVINRPSSDPGTCNHDLPPVCDETAPIRRHDQDRSPTRDHSQSPNKKILLMGDSIFNRINMKGLYSYVHKHSVSGATVKTLLRDIELFDIMNFECILIYIGGNDISGNADHDLLEEQYDQLIAMIKSRNPNIKVILSKLAPRGDVDVTAVNMIIERLTLHHGIEYVDNFRSFYDRNGQLIMRFFNFTDHIHPSNSGIKRILGTINEVIHIVYDFTKCVYPPRAANNYRGNRNVRRTGSTRMDDDRCLNCFESNHQTHECRHKQPITCWYCGLIGHKSDKCWN